MDDLHGELGGRAARRLARRLVREPMLAGERARTARFLGAVRALHVTIPDPGTAERIALRVLDQVEAEERRLAREPARSGARRTAWARIVAVSLTLHVVALALLTAEVRRQEREPGQRVLRASLPAEPLGGEGAEEVAATGGTWLAMRPLPIGWLPQTSPTAPADGWLDEGRWTGGRMADPVLAGALLDEEDDLAPLRAERLRAHPDHLGPFLFPRVSGAAKRGRLTRLGFRAEDTLAVVHRGLDALALRQAADGSFPAEAGTGMGSVGRTGLVLLPFLGDGHGSRSGGHAPVVRRGVAWLRGRLFADPAAVGTTPPLEAALALKALCEDFVLTYGSLNPTEAQTRTKELRLLVARVAGAQGEGGAFPGPEGDLGAQVWPMWALDAAARTGVAPPPARVATQFRTYIAARAGMVVREGGVDPGVSAAAVLLARDLGTDFARVSAAEAGRLVALGAGASDDPLVLAAAGTGLLWQDPEAFRRWSAGLGERLAARFLPTGMVPGTSDPLASTAIHLLALQVAYRTW